MKRLICFSLAAAAALTACRGGGTDSAPSNGFVPAADSNAAAFSASAGAGSRVGLGAVLTTQDRGQVFGFDIDQNGNDGALASSRDTKTPGVFQVSVETFDQDSGAITSSFGKSIGSTSSFAFDGIFAGDTALVTHFVTPKGSLFPVRHYEIMSPVTANKFTGPWNPPGTISLQQHAVNQTTATSVVFAVDLKNSDAPLLVVSDIAKNTVGKVIQLDPNLFQGANLPQLAQLSGRNKAVIALSPDAGAVKVPSVPPVNVLIDLTTGAQTQFNGFNNGGFGPGFVNGLAVDPNTQVAATSTELNAQVEFYDLSKQTGIAAEQLPCTGPQDQGNAAAGIAADDVNKLFLVTEPNYACSGGSAIIVYDETGKQIEVIQGFTFTPGEPAPVINPSKRMGWATGPKADQLQQFFY